MDVSQYPESATGWRIFEEGALHWEKWGEQYALYDALSGETHLLPEFSASLLQLLSTSPRTLAEVAGELCLDSEEICDQAFLEHVSQLLAQLQEAGLTEKIVL